MTQAWDELQIWGYSLRKDTKLKRNVSLLEYLCYCRTVRIKFHFLFRLCEGVSTIHRISFLAATLFEFLIAFRIRACRKFATQEHPEQGRIQRQWNQLKTLRETKASLTACVLSAAEQRQLHVLDINNALLSIDGCCRPWKRFWKWFTMRVEALHTRKTDALRFYKDIF